MQLTLRWLLKYIQINETPNKLIKILEELCLKIGLELEKVNYIDPVYIVKIIKVESQAKLRLKICKDSMNRQILCGASNVFVNNYTIVAPVGTKICGKIIEKKIICAVESEGMFLSYDELNNSFSEFLIKTDFNNDGIINYPNKFQDNFKQELFAFSDVIFSVSIASNRSDLNNVEAIAHELYNYTLLSKNKIISLQPTVDYKELDNELMQILKIEEINFKKLDRKFHSYNDLSKETKEKTGFTVEKQQFFNDFYSLIGFELKNEWLCNLSYFKINIEESLNPINKKELLLIRTTREDIKNNRDLIEEIIKYNGLYNISMKPQKLPKTNLILIDPITNVFYENGFQEVISLPFCEQGEIKLLNSLYDNLTYLRSGFLDSLKKRAERLLNNGYWGCKLFEIGKIWKNNEEIETIAIIIAGKSNRNWKDKTRNYNFFDLKEIVIKLLPYLDLKETNDQNILEQSNVYITDSLFFIEIPYKPREWLLKKFGSKGVYMDIKIKASNWIYIQNKLQHPLILDFYLFDFLEPNIYNVSLKIRENSEEKVNMFLRENFSREEYN